MNTTLTLILLFTIKHFIVDYILQRKFQYMNKDQYGHNGGLLHAILHGFGTILVVTGYCDFKTVVLMAFLDFQLHYHIDWAKANINKKMKWGPTTHDQYWILLGFDQMLHGLTYILIIYIIT